MMRFTFLTLCTAMVLTAQAQEAYTDVIQRVSPGKGSIVIYQDDEIRRLVNNISKAKPNHSQTLADNSAKAAGTAPTNEASSGHTEAPKPITSSHAKVKSTGYRIQVFAGGNSRVDRQKAQKYAAAIRSSFPELPAYTNFVSPRWVCRVGDFRSHAEADEYLRKIRATGEFGQAAIVRSNILVDAGY